MFNEHRNISFHNNVTICYRPFTLKSLYSSKHLQNLLNSYAWERQFLGEERWRKERDKKSFAEHFKSVFT